MRCVEAGLIGALFLAGVIAGAATGQDDHDEYQQILTCCCTPAPCLTCLLEVDPAGNMTTLWTGGPCSGGSDGAEKNNDLKPVYFSLPARTTVPSGGIYYWDSALSTERTIVRNPTVFAGPGEVLVNQDGDLVVATRTSGGIYKLVTVTTSGTIGVISTLFDGSTVSPNAVLTGAIGINIDTGNYLVCDMASQTTPTTVQYRVLEISLDGSTVTTWAPGGPPSNFGLYSAPQEHATGDLEGLWQNNVYRLPKNGVRGVVATLAFPIAIDGVAEFDLQTAKSPRWVAFGSSPLQTNRYFVAKSRTTKPTYTITKTTALSIPTARVDDMVFRMGRHLQTIKTTLNRWNILISCPRFAATTLKTYKYVLAAGMSGVRGPHIPLLSDGRQINLEVDGLVNATVNRWLPLTLWNPGPGTLDSKGFAQGELNLSAIAPPGGLGISLWLAVAVLDPNAPVGIAYLPDTYVMRI